MAKVKQFGENEFGITCLACGVLDPFVGSGTTLAASLIAGRRGIGCEIDETYFQTAVNRLEQTAEALNA